MGIRFWAPTIPLGGPKLQHKGQEMLYWLIITVSSLVGPVISVGIS